VFQLFRQAKLGKLKVLLLLISLGLQVAGTLYLPRLTARLLNYGVLPGDQDYVFSTGALMLVVAVITGVFSVATTYFSAWVATGFARNTRKKLFGHIQKLSYQDYRHFNTSSLITRATNDVEQLQSTLSMVFQSLLPAPFVVVVGVTLSFRSDPYMALIVGIATTVFITLIGIVAYRVLPIFAEVQKGLDKINDKVRQFINGIRVIRAYNRTKLERDHLDASFSKFAALNIKINRLFAAIFPVVLLVMNLTLVAIVWFGGLRIEAGSMQIGDIAAVMEYSMNILWYVIFAVFSIIFIPRAMVCAKRIREVLDYKPEINDGKNHIQQGNLRLEFCGVEFRYQDAENPVLRDLNFVCEQGTTTAIIGGTGSGKSTIARMLPRLLDVSSGQVLINDTCIKDIPQEELRRMVGFVPQNAFLFSGTIANNLRHGNKEATEQDMINAAETAQAMEFISQLPEKFDAPVSQGGRNFSGGQRQRLSIARMLMKQPDIYVFDDSFSALDFKTDAALRAALKPITRKAIVITIAQRIGTIKDADQILVVDEGRIVGSGTHLELLQNCETYLDIAKSQLSEEELAVQETFTSLIAPNATEFSVDNNLLPTEKQGKAGDN